MKKLLLSLTFALIAFFSYAQCDLSGGSTTLVNVLVNGVNTTYTFNLTFNLETNNGNKYFNIDMWNLADYPASLVNNGSKPNCAELATTLTNISINNNVSSPAQPTILTTYDGASCSPAIIPQSSGLIISKQYNPGGLVPAGYDKYTIQNIIITVPLASASSGVKFLVWSSQSAAQSVAHCSKRNITLQPSGGALPVKISSFLVGHNGEAAILVNWKTETEINAGNFEIQRSYDNSSYQTIAAIPSHVNSSLTQSYSYTDNTNNWKGVSYYRIKMLNIDGSFAYTTIKTVTGKGAKPGFVMFPNPSFGNAKISITDISEPTIVQLFDNNGKLVKTVAIKNNNVVELNDLGQGTYIVKTIGTTTGISSVQKLTVIK